MVESGKKSVDDFQIRLTVFIKYKFNEGRLKVIGLKFLQIERLELEFFLMKLDFEWGGETKILWQAIILKLW